MYSTVLSTQVASDPQIKSKTVTIDTEAHQ